MSQALNQVKKSRKVYSLSEEIEPLRRKVAETSSQARRIVEKLAGEIEPLAKSMSALSEESRQQTMNLIETHKKNLEELEKKIGSWSASQEQLVERWFQITDNLQETSKNIRKATTIWRLKFWAAVIFAVLLTMTAHSAVSNFWPLLLSETKRHQNYGRQMENRWNQMNETQKAQFKKLMQW